MAESTTATDAAPAPGGLPDVIAIFPLTGALLLPGGEIPLNIFEPRYLAMIDWALGHGRWLGMVQPRDTAEQTVSNTHPLFGVGCLGRITSFAETPDGRYHIAISGHCRFRLEAELDLIDGFRRVTPDYGAFTDDLGNVELGAAARRELFDALKRYLGRSGYEADWPALENTPDRTLVASMAMACPFEPAEKQALLEARDLAARTRCLIAILEMADPCGGHDGASGHGRPRH